DVVVEPVERELTNATVERIAGIPGIAEVDSRAVLWLPVSGASGQGGLAISNLPQSPELRTNLHIEEGRLPEESGEIALLKSAAQSNRIEIGETLLVGDPMNGNPSEAIGEITVVGILRTDSGLGAIENEGYMTSEAVAALPASFSGDIYAAIHVAANPGIDQAPLAESIQRELGPNGVATAADTFVDGQISEYKESTAILTQGLLAFAFVSLVVAAIVISNTFMILIAQRTREIALFRCAGATRSQVRSAVLAEALIVGLGSAIAGVALATVLANVGLAIAGRGFDVRSLPSRVTPGFGTVLPPVLAGVVMTLAAVWSPARAATSVSPLDALRSSATTVTENRSSRGKLAIAAMLFGGGWVLMALGATLGLANNLQLGVLVGIAGGAIAFLGALLGTGLYVPRLVGLLGGLSERFGGATARLAAANSLRNPRRTSSTAAALVIGVTLVTMMVVGADSLKGGLASEVDERATTDLNILAAGGGEGGIPLSDPFLADVSAIASVEGIASTVSVDGSIAGANTTEELTTRTMAVDPAEARSVRRDTATFDAFGPGIVLLPSWIATQQSIESGDEVTITVGDRSARLTASVADSVEDVYLTRVDAQPLYPAMAPTGVWIDLEEGTDADGVVESVYEIADRTGDAVFVDAVVDYRDQIESALDVMLLIVTGLLTVAVAIALVGVGNTLSLSVLERRRESATLRALGFTRRQLRSMMAVEGMLIAGVGGMIGIVLGTAFGWIGAVTLTGNEFGLHLAFPVLQVLQVLAIMAVALIAGLLASILPGRAAANEPVVAGLAHA
ncbi:MAG: FtsX-like permease family protein, partial [Chloroflexia bacterium]|nr:FtsX-like permease family protein [Chloroflexia bacterium]